MKPTTLLLLATTATTTTAKPTLPQPIPRANTIHYPHPNPHRLLHTLPAVSQQPLSHLLSASAAVDADTTLAGAVLTLLPVSEGNTTTGKGAALLSTITSTFRIPLANIPTSGPTANNSATVYGASFWVGVDAGVSPSGAGCSPSSSSLSGGVAQAGTEGGVLRAGVDIFYDGTLGGHQQPVIWYQGPGQKGETAFEGVVVGEGDLVRLSLVVGPVLSAPGEGVEKGEGEGDGEEGGEVVAIVENFGPDVDCPEGATPIASVRKTFPATTVSPSTTSAPSSTKTSSTTTPTSKPNTVHTRSTAQIQPTLCRKEASWVLQDAPLAGLPNIPIALANFTRVAFTAGITLDDGSVRTLTIGSAGSTKHKHQVVDTNGDGNGKQTELADGVEVLDIRQTQQGGRLTRCGVEEGSEGSEVVCVRVVGE
ncbi:hypothetical protein B0J18DRAFT_408611 [Chaetomium sp. MPI-SDFR-AT-0129]|nr:hypothetical protein B0J18DRAFT_408611 [Chaetomium sp. MPI-SDFR-AT-0129]